MEENRFYVYAYLREDGSPYYIGKGSGKRAWSKIRRVKPPKDQSKILVIQDSLSEEDAFDLERAGIAIFGRKDLGTGRLINLTDGGEGNSGAIRSAATKEKLRTRMLGNTHCVGREYSDETKAKMRSVKLGVPLSDGTKAKMSASRIGNTNCVGRTLSAETRAKIGAAIRR